MPFGRARRQRRRRVAAVGVAGAAIGRRRAEREAAEPEPPAEEAPASDYTAELEKLAKLRDEGVITAEDYEAKKKQLLGI